MSLLESAVENTAKQPIIMIYGKIKDGKTTFCLQAPDNVIIPLEDGLGANKVKWVVRGLDDFNSLKLALEAELLLDHVEYKCITVDSYTALNRMCEEAVKNYAYRMEPTKGKPEAITDGKFTCLAYQNGVNILADKFIEITELLVAIRDKFNVRVHIIAHARNVENKTDLFDPLNTVQTIPDLNPKVYNRVGGLCDIIMMIDDEVDTINLGEGKKKIIREKNKVLRISDPRCNSGVRDSFFRSDIHLLKEKIKDENGNVVGEMPIDLNSFSIKEKETMYARFDSLLIPEIRLVSKKNEKNEKN